MHIPIRKIIFCTIMITLAYFSLSGCMPVTNATESPKTVLPSSMENNAAASKTDVATYSVNPSEDGSYYVELFAMDTEMTLKVYGNHGREAALAAVREIQRFDHLFSTGLSDSCVSTLNAQKKAIWPEDAITVLTEALALYKSTDGAFNISLYPINQAWGFTSDTDYRIPGDTELEALIQHTNCEDILLQEEERQVVISDPDMEIDLGGIVKGFTSNRVMEIFEEYGCESAVVSLGGNVQVLHRKPDGSLWKIAVQNPVDDGNYLAVIQAEDKAVITSGGYERYFVDDNGTVYHHIMDPATGYPANSGLLSVSIISDDGTLADGLSTALFVLGEEKAIDYWRQHADTFDTILYTDDHRLLASGGLKDRITSDTHAVIFFE